ncbi:MAG: helix-turn-helix transcriptional regulator [Erysipelotrichaceae bacterium]
MRASYDKLWKLLIDKKMNKTELKEVSGISFNVLAKMGKNDVVSMDSLMKICCVLNCGVADVIEFLPEENEHNV